MAFWGASVIVFVLSAACFTSACVRKCLSASAAQLKACSMIMTKNRQTAWYSHRSPQHQHCNSCSRILTSFEHASKALLTYLLIIAQNIDPKRLRQSDRGLQRVYCYNAMGPTVGHSNQYLIIILFLLRQAVVKHSRHDNTYLSTQLGTCLYATTASYWNRSQFRL